MKHACFVCLFLCLTTAFLLSQSNRGPLTNHGTSVMAPISASQPDPKAQTPILNDYGKLPLSFEANHGQADSRVKFLSRTGGYSLFLTADEAVLAWTGKANAHKAKIAGIPPMLPSDVAQPKGGGVLRMKLRIPILRLRSLAWMSWRARATTSSATIRRSGGRMFRLTRR